MASSGPFSSAKLKDAENPADAARASKSTPMAKVASRSWDKRKVDISIQVDLMRIDVYARTEIS